jgi:hypothetical protein
MARGRRRCVGVWQARRETRASRHCIATVPRCRAPGCCCCCCCCCRCTAARAQVCQPTQHAAPLTVHGVAAKERRAAGGRGRPRQLRYADGAWRLALARIERGVAAVAGHEPRQQHLRLLTARTHRTTTDGGVAQRALATPDRRQPAVEARVRGHGARRQSCGPAVCEARIHNRRACCTRTPCPPARPTAHLMGMLPVGILTCSRANMALSESMPLARLMSDTCTTGHAASRVSAS